MAIDLYSKTSIDALLGGKYDASNPSGYIEDAPIDGSTYGRKDGAWEVVSGSGGLTISTLSNGATSTLNSTAPTTGQALTFDGTDLVWATVGGGGGGATWGSITGTLSDQTDLWTELGNKAAASGSTAISVSSLGGTCTLGADSGGSVSADNGSGSVTKLTTTGITFPDSTTQTTAAVGGANFGDAFTLGKVQDVSSTGGYWQITFAPVNAQAMNLGLYICLSDGSNAEAVTSYSTTSTWTYTTSTNTSSDYIYIKYNGQVSSIAISNP